MNIPLKNLILLSTGIVVFSLAVSMENGLLGAVSGLMMGTAVSIK